VAWERRRKLSYCTQTRKRRGRSERVYVGRGPLALLAYHADQLLQAEGLAVAEARKAERARWKTTLAPVVEFERLTNLLSRALLLTAGFYQHDRGQCRKRGGQTHGERKRSGLP
jgi:hypothetical protein